MQSGAIEADLLEQMVKALHEMCQPLTVLQCRLELDLMESGLAAELVQTGADCLRECERLNARVATLRSLVQRAQKEERERHD